MSSLLRPATTRNTSVPVPQVDIEALERESALVRESAEDTPQSNSRSIDRFLSYGWLSKWQKQRKSKQTKALVSALYPKVQKALLELSQWIEQEAIRKTQIIESGLQLQRKLDKSIKTKQHIVDTFDDLVNDYLSLSYDMTKAMRHLKAALDFNEEQLSTATRRRSCSRLEPLNHTEKTAAATGSVSQISSPLTGLSQSSKNNTNIGPKISLHKPLTVSTCCDGGVGGDESRPAEPAVWHGYKGAEAVQLRESKLSPKNPMIHYSKSPATASLISMITSQHQSHALAGPSHYLSSTSKVVDFSLKALINQPSPCFEIDSDGSPATSGDTHSDCASDGSLDLGSHSSGSVASDASFPEISCHLHSISLQGCFESDHEAGAGFAVISLPPRPTTPTTTPISNSVLAAHATSCMNTSTTVATPELVRKPSRSLGSPLAFTATSSLDFLSSAYAISGSLSDSDYVDMTRRYVASWNIYSSAQQMIETLKMERDAKQSALSHERRQWDVLCCLCRGDLQESSELPIRDDFDFGEGGRIHESFTRSRSSTKQSVSRSENAGKKSNGTGHCRSSFSLLSYSLSVNNLFSTSSSSQKKESINSSRFVHRTKSATSMGSASATKEDVTTRKTIGLSYAARNVSSSFSQHNGLQSNNQQKDDSSGHPVFEPWSCRIQSCIDALEATLKDELRVHRQLEQLQILNSECDKYRSANL